MTEKATREQTHAAAPASAPDPGIARFGLYVVASDLDRASAFYERLFQKPPQVRTPGLVGFDVAGALYAIVSQQAYAPNVQRGDNVLPYLRVKDIDAELARVCAIETTDIRTPGVVSEGPFRFFKLADPDGNLLEFFSVAAR
ncbi:MAG TPA: VOC family protein [Polyangiales bacterium]|nr:VOC family protein [Polyangiales bacterium]